MVRRRKPATGWNEAEPAGSDLEYNPVFSKGGATRVKAAVGNESPKWRRVTTVPGLWARRARPALLRIQPIYGE